MRLGVLHLCRLLSVALVIFCLSACERRRPPGYLRIGKVVDLTASEQFIPGTDVYLRRDSYGYYAMSTLCSHDLSKLALKATDKGEIWVSQYTTSTYDKQGNVLTGPATEPLPFYKLRFASEVYGGPPETLYVEIGSEVPKGWRLSVSSPVAGAGSR